MEALNHVLSTVKAQFLNGNEETPLRKQLEKGRNRINKELEEFPSIGVVVHPIKHAKEAKDKLHELSENVNIEFPYTSMLLRNHGTYIAAGITGLVGLTTFRAGKKLFLFSSVAAILACYGSIKLVDYKWSHPHNEKK